MKLSSSHLPSICADYDVDVWVQCDWYLPTDGRYYWAQLQQDLFHNWILIKHWGKMHSRSGRSMEALYESYEDGVSQLAAVEKRRSQRGYVAYR